MENVGIAQVWITYFFFHFRPALCRVWEEDVGVQVEVMVVGGSLGLWRRDGADAPPTPRKVAREVGRNTVHVCVPRPETHSPT